jgi:hypothetical protein
LSIRKPAKNCPTRAHRVKVGMIAARAVTVVRVVMAAVVMIVVAVVIVVRAVMAAVMIVVPALSVRRVMKPRRKAAACRTS